MVAAATLCGAGSFEDGTALFGVVPGTGDLTQDRLSRLDTWLGGLYPAEPGQRWGSLQPDRLGEYLIAAALPEISGLLGALLAATDAARQHRALTILARALANPALAAPQATQLSAQVGEAFTGDLHRLGPVAVQVISEAADPRALLKALHDAAASADETVLGELVAALPESSQALADLAAQWTTRLVAHLRTHAGAVANPDAVTPDLALALTTQAGWCGAGPARGRAGRDHRSGQHPPRAGRCPPRRLPPRPGRGAEQPVQLAGSTGPPRGRAGRDHRGRRHPPRAGRRRP